MARAFSAELPPGLFPTGDELWRLKDADRISNLHLVAWSHVELGDYARDGGSHVYRVERGNGAGSGYGVDEISRTHLGECVVESVYGFPAA